MRLSQAPTSSRSNTLPLGEMRFVASTDVSELCNGLCAQRFLVVGAATGPLAPTGLRRRIDDAVEGELAARGALPAAIGVDAELSSCIRDQVFRTRALGSMGLAIALPPLSELTDPEGRLNVDDSAALLAWTRATAELPVVLLASEADKQVSAYAPMPLERLLAAEGRAAAPAPPPAVDEATWLEASREPPADPFDMTPAPVAVAPAREEARHRTPAPPAVVRPRTTPVPPAVATREEAPRAELSVAARMMLSAPSDEENGAPKVDVAVVARATEARATQDGAPPKRLKSGILKGTKTRLRHEERPVEARAPHADGADGDEVHDLFSAEPARPATTMLSARDTARETDSLRMRLDDALRVQRPEETLHETATIPVRARDTGASRAVTSAEWRNQAVELDAARGPKPPRVIEQLFMTKYSPLLGALARGEADGAVRAIVEGWAQAFEHSYTDAFSAMRVTGKRPMMTFDAPEIATRIARLNGARGVKLLLVDGMSFDLGERVAAELRARSTASGVCVDRLLLWSALPTTTPMQVALLSKGPDALRDTEPPSEQEHEIARGRAVGTLRRERAGTRELMKLDLVEARLRTAGPAYEERLDALADEVTNVLARYLESLPARTLLFIFGDHGFRLPRSADGRGTGPATQGGASPEEVLVPAYAWLAGGVH